MNWGYREQLALLPCCPVDNFALSTGCQQDFHNVIHRAVRARNATPPWERKVALARSTRRRVRRRTAADGG